MKQPNKRAVVHPVALLVLFSILFTVDVFAQTTVRAGKIAQRVETLKQKAVFSKETPLFKSVLSTTADPLITAAVKKYTLVEAQGIETIQQEKPAYLSITIPVDNGKRQVKVLLYKENILADGFALKTEKGTVASVQDVANYRGCIDNDPASLAALTFANSEVSGFVSNNEGNYVIGQSGNNKARHIIYNDADLAEQVPFDCGTNTFAIQSPASLARPGQAAASSNKCVNWYWEADYDLFVNKGSLPAVNAYLQGVFNQMGTLYANDGLTMLLRALFVWTEEDPYTGTSTSGYLTQFGNYRTSFDGDLAHLIGLRGSGGIAWVNGLCKTNKYRMAYSGISSSYQTVPTYSWTVECITHEQGHLLGSQHTHDCSWNGNNTKIDGCGDNAGYTSGTCANPGNPSGGGTIMSYCHLLQGVGINFNTGFGPQPLERITNTINAATCLSTCGTCTVPSQPAAITGSATVCAGTSQTYSVAAVSGATSYTWWLPSGWTGTSITNSITVTAGSTAGTISVSADNSCGKSIVKALTVSISSAIAAPALITGSATVCPATSQTYTAAAVSGATSYTWVLPSGWTGTSTTNSITVTTGTTGGNISVTANSSSCGSSTARAFAVSISSAIAAPALITGSATVCPATSQTYTAAAVSGATSYTWALPSGWTGTSTTNSIAVTTGTTGGQLTVKAVSNCGQSAATTIAIAIISAAPAQPAAISGNTSVCDGSAQTYSVAAVAGAASYTWLLPPGWTGTSTTNSIAVTAGAAGNISVAAVSGCGTSAARTLSVSGGARPAAPATITVSGGSSSVCTGDVRTYTTPLVSSVTYTWDLPMGAAITSGQGTNSIQVNFSSSFVSGSSVSVRAANSCGNSAATSLPISKITPAAPAAISGSNNSCPNRYKQYYVASVKGAASYIWTVPAGSSFWGSSTGRSVWVRLGSTSGNITVKAVNACGTSAASTKYITIACTSGIEPTAIKQPAAIYPNPATDIATVRFNADVKEACTVSIMDAAGRMLSKQSLTVVTGVNTHSIVVSDYLPGTYFVMVQGKTIKEVLRLNIK